MIYPGIGPYDSGGKFTKTINTFHDIVYTVRHFVRPEGVCGIGCHSERKSGKLTQPLKD